jgi:hypothetical protein
LLHTGAANLVAMAFRDASRRSRCQSKIGADRRRVVGVVLPDTPGRTGGNIATAAADPGARSPDN